MSRNKQREMKSKAVNCQLSDISESKLIEINAEAYYRALKRIEEEKKREEKKEEKNSTPLKKDKWYMNILFILNFLFFPFKINKRFQLRKQMYDSVLQLFVIMILEFSGILMWLAGLLHLIYVILSGFIWIYASFDIVIALFGSLFYMAGQAFSKERDSNKIYAYSASILALVSCIVSVIALINGVF